MWKIDPERIAESVQSAPSIFNSKPWLLDPVLKPVADDRIELHASSGALAEEGGRNSAGWLQTEGGNYIDPLAREFAISCGAALFNLRLAIRVAGHDLMVWLLPGRKPVTSWPPPDSTLLASVEIVTARIKPPTIAEQELYEAIWRRHTNRWPNTIVPAPLPVIVAMENAAAREGASLRLLNKHQANRWMHLVAEADEDLASGDAYRYGRYREERARLIPGVPYDTFGPAPEDGIPRTREDFWLDDEKRKFERPQLMALSTQDDQLLDWLRAGQALQRAILTGTRRSVSAPYGAAAGYRHAPRWYGVPASGHLFRHDDLARYGLSVSFLTQPLECYDIEHPLRLENIHGEPRSGPRRVVQRRHRPWRDAEPRHWPWRWRFPELPQMVLRVGYATGPAQADARAAALALGDRVMPSGGAG